MNCKQTESRLMDYIEGTLAARDRQAVEFHARSCSSCAERLQGFAEVSRALDGWEDMDPSLAFDARLEERLARESSAGGLWDRFFPEWTPSLMGSPVYAMALFVMISLAAVLVGYSPARWEKPVSRQVIQQAAPFAMNVAAGADDLTLYRDLPVLEDLDVLRNFEVLQDLGGTPQLQQ